MAARFRVVLQGFSDFERSALTFCLKLTVDRDATYDPAPLMTSSDFVIANADAPGVIDAVVQAGRTPDTVFVGRNAPEDATSHLTRPIDPQLIVRALDGLLARRRSLAAQRVEVMPPVLIEAPDFPQLDDIEEVEPATDPMPLAMRVKPPPAPSTPIDAESADAPDSIPPLQFDEDVAADDSPASAIDAALSSLPAAVASSMSLPTLEAYEAAPPPAPEVQAASSLPLGPTSPAPIVEQRSKARTAARAAARAAARRARLANAERGEAADPTPDVLVLDDSEIAQAHLCRLLTDFGFRAHAVPSGQEALDLLARQAFSVVFFDVQLDEHDDNDGIDLCHRVKHQMPERNGSVPAVVIVSGQARAADRVRAGLAGCDIYLTKPLSRGSVARALESCGIALPSDARRL